MAHLTQFDAGLKPPSRALELAQETILRLIGAVIAGAGGATTAGAPQGGEGLVLPGSDRRLSVEDLAEVMTQAGQGIAGAQAAAILLAHAAGGGASGRALLRALALVEEAAARGADGDALALARATLGGTAPEGTVLEVPDDFGRVWQAQAGAKPTPEPQLWHDFHAATETVLPREQIAPLFERLMTLEDLSDCAGLLRMAEVSGLHRPQPAKVVFAPKDMQDTPETTWVP